MSDEKENLQLPPKPEMAITTALKWGGIAGLIGAVVGAISAKIPILRAIYYKGAAKEAAETGMIGGMVGAVYGYVNGVREHAEYPLKVENTGLRNRINELEGNKPFMETVAQEKLEKQTELPGRP